MTTSAGQKVTVNTASSTTYQDGTSASSASAVTKGKSVLVLGTTNGTTITASQVIVAAAGGGSATASSARVVAFQRGAASTSKQVGQIPANYSQGSGTIVSGTDASKATEAALAAYPGGVVDRVVKLSRRRVRGPQHRRQLAAPHLRQPGIQGRRRGLVPTNQRPGGLPRGGERDRRGDPAGAPPFPAFPTQVPQ